MESSPREQRKLAAIVFTDMVGFSALSQKNVALALEALDAQNGLVRAALPAHNGREIKATGDGFLLLFDSALDAVRCAREIQKAVTEYNATATADRRFQMRIGIHVADVIHREADLVGDGVNIAARVEPLAPAGGICLTGAVVEQIRNKVSDPVERLPTPAMKNIDSPVDVYRLVLPWDAEQPAVVRGRPAHRSPRLLLIPLAAATAVVAIVGAALFLLSGHENLPSQSPGTAGSAAKPARYQSLAVLPLRNLSGDPKEEFFADGMTEALTTDLARVGSIRVTSATSAMQFKGEKAKTLPQIAQVLNVEAVVEGSVQRSGDRIQITAQLIDARSDTHLWADQYEKKCGDVLKLQNEVAMAIAKQIEVKLTPDEQKRLTTARTVDPAAHELYLKGRAEFNKVTNAGLHRAIALFEKSAQRDPRYAQAYSGLADSYAYLGMWGFGAPSEVYPEAKRAARRAIELDPSLSEAHAALGFTLLLYDWDRNGGEAEFKKALELDPSNAWAHSNSIDAYAVPGRTGEAVAECRRACDLDPLSVPARLNLAVALYLDRRFDDAIMAARRTIEMDPSFPTGYMMLGAALKGKGQTKEAAEALIKLRELEGNRKEDVTTLRKGFALAGFDGYLRAEVQLMKKGSATPYLNAFWIAMDSAQLGDRDAAFHWLEIAYPGRLGWFMELQVEPYWDPIRSDPRFAALVARVKPR